VDFPGEVFPSDYVRMLSTLFNVSFLNRLCFLPSAAWVTRLASEQHIGSGPRFPSPTFSRISRQAATLEIIPPAATSYQKVPFSSFLLPSPSLSLNQEKAAQFTSLFKTPVLLSFPLSWRGLAYRKCPCPELACVGGLTLVVASFCGPPLYLPPSILWACAPQLARRSTEC